MEFETKICLTNKQVSVCDACLLSLLSRTLLQQLQRLQAMVAGKVSRSCKAASTQTGTCLMVSGTKAGNCKGMRNSFHSLKAHLLFSKASQWQICSLGNSFSWFDNFEGGETCDWWRLMTVGSYWVLEETGPVLLVRCCSDERSYVLPRDPLYYFLQYYMWEMVSKVVKLK